MSALDPQSLDRLSDQITELKILVEKLSRIYNK